MAAPKILLRAAAHAELPAVLALYEALGLCQHGISCALDR